MTTKTALLGIRDYLLPAMKRGEVSLMFFYAGYSKVFDTDSINQGVRFRFFTCLECNAWTTVDYLSDRCQFVEMDDKTSSIETVLFGVPQGSILGPFMFNLYMSDLQKHIKCPCYQYADYTTFFVH